MESCNKLFFVSLIPFFFFLSIFIISGQQVVLASAKKSSRSFNPTKLFVFGDSYSDTGNTRKSQDSSWKFPHGIIYPGKPTGRFSDGRVLTDFIARSIGVKSPVAYQWRKVVDSKQLEYGMNFAFGGTGVFNTWVDYPNMTVQIDYFQRLINESLYPSKDLQSSVALVTVAGNDYYYYEAFQNGTDEGFPTIIASVVKQIHINLKRIHDLGVKEIAMISAEPYGCLPQNSRAYSFTQCRSVNNAIAAIHNILLEIAMEKLNNETNGSPFRTQDLYNSFMSVIKEKGDRQGNIKFENILKPCCAGTSSEYFCGSVDKNGQNRFTICKKPQSVFFWDETHPTDQGWRAIYSNLQDTVRQLLY